MPETVRIDRRFCGVPGIPLGGYVAGILGSRLGAAVRVRLLRPAPTDCELTVDVAGDGAQLRDGDAIIAAAQRIDRVDVDVPRVSSQQALAATERFPGMRCHMFPTCFCCGTGRDDGLRIFAGPVDGRPLVAAPWATGAAPWAMGAAPWATGAAARATGAAPRATGAEPRAIGAAAAGPRTPLAGVDAGAAIPSVLLWTALDCPAIWGQIVEGPQVDGLYGLTGQVEVEVLRPAAVGADLIVAGWPLGVQGRRVLAAAAILTSAGETVAVSRQTLVLTDKGFPLTLAGWAAESGAA